VPDSIIRRQKQHFSNIGSVFPDNEIDSYIININDSDKVYLFGPSYAYNFSDSFSMGATLYVYYRDMEFVRNQLLMFSQGEHIFINYYETKKEWGCKPILGFIYEPFDRLALGFTISKIAIRSSDNEQQTIFRNTISTDYSNTNTINYSRAKNSEENKFPTTFCLGIAYFFSPRLLLSTDFTFHKEISDKESVINVSLGTEFYFTDTMA
ncbi:MAG: hypothetical protein GY855_08865, partial [candidate division Zixibacteria bacterium]|nr:hypothetical protein [candidate division Zixibacteria bacterium]